MIAFLRRWYIAVALVWWLCGAAAFVAVLEVGRSSSSPGVFLFWTLLFITEIVPAALLASRGFQRTTTGKVFASIYAVALVPMMLFAIIVDAYDHIRFPHESWASTSWFLGIGLEGGFLIAPAILFISFIVSFLINLFAEYEPDD